MKPNHESEFGTVTYKKRVFKIRTTPTLLAHLRAHQVPVNQSWLRGYWGTCKTKLCHGEVVYHTPPLAFLHDNEVLTCISLAKTYLCPRG